MIKEIEALWTIHTPPAAALLLVRNELKGPLENGLMVVILDGCWRGIQKETLMSETPDQIKSAAAGSWSIICLHDNIILFHYRRELIGGMTPNT